MAEESPTIKGLSSPLLAQLLNCWASENSMQMLFCLSREKRNLVVLALARPFARQRNVLGRSTRSLSGMLAVGDASFEADPKTAIRLGSRRIHRVSRMVYEESCIARSR